MVEETWGSSGACRGCVSCGLGPSGTGSVADIWVQQKAHEAFGEQPWQVDDCVEGGAGQLRIERGGRCPRKAMSSRHVPRHDVQSVHIECPSPSNRALASLPFRPSMHCLTTSLDRPRHQRGLLVGEVRHIVQDLLHVRAARSLLKRLLALPLERSLHTVRSIAAELEDFPALEAVLGELLRHQGHVRGEVVFHVEFGALRVEDCRRRHGCGRSYAMVFRSIDAILDDGSDGSISDWSVTLTVYCGVLVTRAVRGHRSRQPIGLGCRIYTISHLPRLNSPSCSQAEGSGRSFPTC